MIVLLLTALVATDDNNQVAQLSVLHSLFCSAAACDVACSAAERPRML